MRGTVPALRRHLMSTPPGVKSTSLPPEHPS